MVSGVVPFLRPFPWDVLLLILQHSDPSTLAALARVSFDVLVASSSILYKDISLRYLHRLERLFCGRDDTSPSSRINPHLSLSQTRNIHLNFVIIANLLPSFTPSYDRIAHLPPLELDLLRISFNRIHCMVLDRFHRLILPALNPVRLEYVSVNDKRLDYDDRPWFDFGNIPVPLLDGWTRIETIDLSGIVPATYIARDEWGDPFLACLPAPSLDRRRVVRLHLDTLVVAWGEKPNPGHGILDATGLLDWLMVYEDSGSILQGDLMQAGSIVLVVESEELRREARREVSGTRSVTPWS